MRVLVTGAFGWTAKAIVEALVAAGYHVIALDLPDSESHVDMALFTNVLRGSVSDYEFVLEACKNVDVIVHLAVATNGGYDTPEIPFDVNVRGTANIYAAAHHHPVERVILMSSAPFHVTYPTKINAINDRLQGIDGDFMYDMTKCLQEDIASYYAKTLGIKTITLRAGHIVDGRTNLDPEGRKLEALQYGRGAWVCRYDLARAVMQALNYDGRDYDAFHIIGAEAAKIQFDMQGTEHLLGFVPAIRFEDYQ